MNIWQDYLALPEVQFLIRYWPFMLIFFSLAMLVHYGMRIARFSTPRYSSPGYDVREEYSCPRGDTLIGLGLRKEKERVSTAQKYSVMILEQVYKEVANAGFVRNGTQTEDIDLALNIILIRIYELHGLIAKSDPERDEVITSKDIKRAIIALKEKKNGARN